MELFQEQVLYPEVKQKLQELIETKHLTNYKIDATKGSNPGENFFGVIARIKITGLIDNEEVKYNWIVKAAPQLATYRRHLNVAACYGREIYMYEQVFPFFEDFQSRKSIREPFDEHAEFIFSSAEELNEFLVMEDLREKNYKLPARQETLDYKHVKLVVEAYAKFHAVSYAVRDQNVEAFENLKENLKDVFYDGQDKMKAFRTQKFYMDGALKTLKPHDSNVLEKFKLFSERFVDIYVEAVTTVTDYSVVTHGDCWINNMMFKYNDDTKEPTKVCLIDFQISRLASPACDLSYFIFSSTDKSLRDQHYDELIRFYHDVLTKNINEMGSRPEELISLDSLTEELKKFSVSGLYMTLMKLWFLTKTKDDILHGRNEDVYADRVRGILIDYYDKGYFDYL